MSRAVSIHIGVDNPGGPGDSRTVLRECESTAWRMAELAYQAGYDSMLVLRGATATVSAVQAALFNASQLLERGDFLLVSYSGHGGQQRNFKADERDQMDESWSLHDGELVDDTLAGWWRQFRPGVRIVMVSESCFSGGMDRGDDEGDVPDHWKRRRWMRSERRRFRDDPDVSCIVSRPRDCAEIRATVLMLTASRDYQESQEKLFTDCLLEVWDGGRFPGSYCQLYQKVREKVMNKRPNQHPQILMLGTPDLEFPRNRAFHRSPTDPGPPAANGEGPRPRDPEPPRPDPRDDDWDDMEGRGRRSRERIYR